MKNNKAEKTLVNIIAAALVVFAMSGLWFAFDEAAADLFSQPILGELRFWEVVSFLWFFKLVITLPRIRVSMKHDL